MGGNLRLVSVVPAGLSFLAYRYPALKRRAILIFPSGKKAERKKKSKAISDKQPSGRGLHRSYGPPRFFRKLGGAGPDILTFFLLPLLGMVVTCAVYDPFLPA